MRLDAKVCFGCFGSDLLAEFYSGAMVTKGVLAALFGLMFLLMPSLLPWTVGVVLVMNGAFALASAFAMPKGRWFFLFYSLFAVLLGIFIMANPLGWEFAAIWVLGIWMAAGAVVQVIRLIGGRDRSVPIFLQILSVFINGFLGVTFFLHPFVGAIAVNAFAGAALIVFGLFFVAFGVVLKLRRRPGEAVEEAQKAE